MQAIAYPVVEEVAFRGLLQGWLSGYARARGTWMGISGANAMTSIVFASLHLWNHAPAWALAILVPSMIFGYFRDRYDGWLVSCIALHCFYNAGAGSK